MLRSGPMETPQRLIASFTGAGVLGATPMLRCLEALERRKAEYHKAIPARVEVARERHIEDRSSWVGEGGAWRRTIEVTWEDFHREPELATHGLDGLRPRMSDLPAGLRGLRVRLGYAFPKQDARPLELAFHLLDGARWEVQLAAPAELVLDRAQLKLSRAVALLFGDLAEGLYDVLEPAYGALRLDAGVLQDQLPASGWGFYAGALVERVGRGPVEALAQRCYKSWELADGGWLLAPAPLDSPDRELEAARAGVFAACRHLPLEAMRGGTWKAD